MENEPLVRLIVFALIFAVMAGWEGLRPARARAQTRTRRWAVNWAIAIIDTVVVRLLFPAAAVGVALDAASAGVGLFNALDWPLWLEVVLVMVALDFAIWAQHLVSHKVPVLWRLHRVHHSDRDVDVTTAIRFHPVEIALSMVLKIALVYALGAPALAVILFEIVLNGSAMFNHSNLHLPAWAERPVRAVMVTPDMHRIHHSTLRREHDRNYGFNLSIWDRIFGTYLHAPKGGQDGMTIGLADHQDDAPGHLGWALIFPFRKR
ncbi:MAG: sterol desaturase/sphingolipid hydroxylase (fatty acid hydroxylase superfamily) [Paracoccaceae bacterium]|jgi:sterol desaturase/sphingolipid hydroxylase (fatty acid hydroxylase superfamily)